MFGQFRNPAGIEREVAAERTEPEANISTSFDLSSAAQVGWDLAPALLGRGLGMRMILVPLIDVIMGEVRDHEVGSASAILESLQQLGASIGVTVLGTVFSSAVGEGRRAAPFLRGAQHITPITIGLIVAAFLLGFLLPRRARRPEPAAVRANDAADVADVAETVGVGA